MRDGIAAAAFDLDGTLYPNYSLYVRLLPFILKEWRLVWAFGKARDLIHAEGERGGGNVPAFHEDFYDYQARITAEYLGAKPALVKAKIERLIYRGWERHFTKVKLFPYVKETLAALRRAGLRLGLLSDFPPETKLACLGIGDCWDIVLCTERLGALKPDYRVFGRLAEDLELEPEQILFIGNSRRYDITGAKQTGMKAALITGPFSETGAGKHGVNVFSPVSPDFVFRDYRQLLKYMID